MIMNSETVKPPQLNSKNKKTLSPVANKLLILPSDREIQWSCVRHHGSVKLTKHKVINRKRTEV